MPWPYLMSRLLGLLSLAVLATGLWFVVDWLDTDLRSKVWLVGGLLLLGLALFGRTLVLLGLGRDGGRSPPPRRDGAETVIGSAGCELYVEHYGPPEGELIVLTCGWGFDRLLWADVVRTLQDRFRLMVWDPPGVGRSGRPFDDHYSIERFTDDLGAVLTLARGRPVLLVGHGLGALPVMELFRRGRHGTVAGVALLNAAAAPPIETSGEAGVLRRLRKPVLEPLLSLDVWFSPVVRLAALAGYLSGGAHLVVRSAACGAEPTRHAVDRAAWMAAGQAPSVQARGLRAALSRDGGDPAVVSTPLLVVAGGRDALVEADACRRTAEAAPDGALIVLEDVGHLGPLEAPAACAAAIAAHARKAFTRAAALRSHAETTRAHAVASAIPPEPRSWVASADPEGDRGDDRPEPPQGGGVSAAPPSN